MNQDRADRESPPSAEFAEETIDHLQRAATDMVRAARGFLDVIEEVVADRSRLTGVAANVTEVLAAASESVSRLAGWSNAGTGSEAGSEAGSETGSEAGGGTRRRESRRRVRRIVVDDISE